MPYVIQLPGGYLVRDGAHNRRLTADLQEATVWTKPGHAKNAARAAAEDRRLKLGHNAKAAIMAVNVSLCVERPVIFYNIPRSR